MKKRSVMFCLLAAFLTISMLASGCAPGAQKPAAAKAEAGPAKGDVIVWGWADQWLEVFDEYKKINPNLKVDYIPVDAGVEFITKFTTAINSGTDVPDMAWMELGSRGKLLSIPNAWEKLEKPPYNLNRAEMLEGCIPLCTNTEGEILGVECGPGVAGMAYRRDLAREYFGTDDPKELEKIITSWDVITERGIEVRTLSNGEIFMFSSLSEVFQIMNDSSSIPYIVEGKLNLDKAIYPFLQKLEKMRDDKIVDLLDAWTPAWNASYAERRHIFAPCATWSPRHVIKPNDPEGSGNWGLMMPPTGAFNWGGTLFGIPTAAKNKAGSWELIKWSIFSEDGGKVVRDKIQFLSAYKPIYNNPDFYNVPDEYFGGQNVMGTFAELLTKVKPKQIIPEDSVINDSIGQGIKSMVSGASADEALKLIKDEIVRKIPELG